MKTTKFYVFETVYVLFVCIFMFYTTLAALIVGLPSAWGSLTTSHDIISVMFAGFTIIAEILGIILIGKVCLFTLPKKYRRIVELYTQDDYSGVSTNTYATSLVVAVLSFFSPLPMLLLVPSELATTFFAYAISCCLIVANVMMLLMVSAIWFMSHYRRVESHRD